MRNPFFSTRSPRLFLKTGFLATLSMITMLTMLPKSVQASDWPLYEATHYTQVSLRKILPLPLPFLGVLRQDRSKKILAVPL